MKELSRFGGALFRIADHRTHEGRRKENAGAVEAVAELPVAPAPREETVRLVKSCLMLGSISVARGPELIHVKPSILRYLPGGNLYRLPRGCLGIPSVLCEASACGVAVRGWVPMVNQTLDLLGRQL